MIRLLSKKRWLLALIVSSAVVPSGALLVVGHAGFAEHEQRVDTGLPDVIIDQSDAARGTKFPATAVDEGLAGLPRKSRWTSDLLTHPVAIENENGRRLVQLTGVEPDERRLSRLASLVVAGRVEELSAQGIALGEKLASSLGAQPGDEVRVLGLDPGAEALGFRKRTFEVVALLRSGMVRFDETVAVTTLEATRALNGSNVAVNGVEAWFEAPLPSGSSREGAVSKALPHLRTGLRGQRDWPRRDRVAQVGLARSTLVIAFLVAFLAAALCGITDRGPYREYLARYAPVAGISITLALLASLATATLALEPSTSVPLEVRGDLGRLFLAVSVGLLLSPILFGRLNGLAALVVLGVVVTFATSEPAANSLAASASRRNAEKLVDAAESASLLASSEPLSAVLWSGSEVVPVSLVGLDPERPGVGKLLRVLTEGGEPILRPKGAEQPPPWILGGRSFEELLERLATRGTTPEPGRVDSEAPPMVIGNLVARQLGVDAGASVRLAAVPAEVSLEEDVTPHPPVTFRVESVARLGLTSIDRSLALVDAWQVRALGGTTQETDDGGVPTAFRARQDASDAARAPFASRARRISVASAIQISIVCFLLGGFVAIGRRRIWELVLWMLAGTVVGAVVGYGEAMSGMVEIVDRATYEALPRSGAGLSNLFSPWTLLPCAIAIVAAAIGYRVKVRS